MANGIQTQAMVHGAPDIPGMHSQVWKDGVVQRIEGAVDWLEETSHREPESTKHSLDTPALSIVIPAYNERRTIEQVIERVSALPIDKQIILVDDASTDGTREILSRYIGRKGFDVVVHPCNQGKGAALKSGFQLARGEVVIVQDADLEYDPQDILSVIAPILEGRSDVVYGSRYLMDGRQDPSAIHRLGNWLLTQFSNWMTANRLTDMETCYKAIRRTLLQSIDIEQKRFGFEPEITAKLARRGHRILEVPVSYRSRSWKEGKKIGFKDLINTLWCIVRYRFN
ncbi:MAG: glycosyltransferase family 2 protein [Planctomycetota bacterium]|jgi:glycosyltransferase involved in cell wall biosynthesis